MDNTISNAGKFYAINEFRSELLILFWDLRWLIAFAVVLIMADFWLGTRESIKKKIDVRGSRAGRRTMNKIVDYVCYLAIGGTLGMAIGEPLGISHIAIAAGCMILACGFEIDSIVGHICELHGFKKVSIRKFIISLLKKKNKDIGEALEETINEEEKK